MGARVLIVDDHAGFRAHARRLFECEGYHVVGEAGDCASALIATEELRPDVVLVDVHLPDGNGFALATRLTGLADAPTVVLTSSRSREELGGRVEQSGARGFVPKSELCRDALEELMKVG
jgi:DNA-binding NarL/FixJ family response regulator